VTATEPRFTSVIGVTERFLQLFKDHNVATTEIPRLIPQITLEQLRDVDTLLSALTNEVIKNVANLFGVQREWIEGTSEQIYNPHYCYHYPEVFFQQFDSLNRENVFTPVVAFCLDQKLDYKREKEQPIVLVMIEKCADLGWKRIECYRIVGDDWGWEYWKSRFELKGLMRLLNNWHDESVPMYRVDKDTLYEIAAGYRVPWTYLQKRSRVSDTCLEDYALFPEESRMSKESEELPLVLEYMENRKFEKRAKWENESQGGA